jgi:hypothetical protein
VLALSDTQLARVEALERARLGAAMAPVLASLWPAVAEKLGERWPAFVAAAIERASQHGIEGDIEQARFVALCGLWGASFDARPGFEWAAEVLQARDRSGRLKLHQLLSRARAELPLTGPVTRGNFEATLATSDLTVAALSRAARVFADTPDPVPMVACDLGTVALATGTSAPLSLTDPPPEPLELEVLTPTPFKLATQAIGGCGLHPELRHDSSAGRLVWRGADAQRIALTLPAPTEREPGLTGIGHSPAPETHRFSLCCCGVRDAGAPFGDLDIELRAFPRTAWQLGLQHGAWSSSRQPEPGPVTPAVLRLKLEADARELDTAPWQREWLTLQTQWQAGLEKLFNAWARTLESPTLESESSLLAGEARLAWGFKEGPSGITMQTTGRIDLIAAKLDLRLGGQLRWGDSLAELRLQAEGRHAWQQDVEPGADLEAVACSWRQPAVLALLPRLTPSPALLAARPGAVAALNGKAGLRPRPDGRGHQWFCKIDIEAVPLSLAKADPLLGERREPRTLIPAMTLLDWSSG